MKRPDEGEFAPTHRHERILQSIPLAHGRQPRHTDTPVRLTNHRHPLQARRFEFGPVDTAYTEIGTGGLVPDEVEAKHGRGKRIGTHEALKRRGFTRR